MVFGVCVCMCVHWLGGLNLLLALCSKYYNSMQIYQIFSISSLVLGVVITQIWLLCSDWLCFFWSRCHDPHTCSLQKCLYLAQYWFQKFPMNNQLIVLELKDFWLIFENKMAVIGVFLIFILYFLSHSYYGCVIATVFNLSGEIRY